MANNDLSQSGCSAEQIAFIESFDSIQTETTGSSANTTHSYQTIETSNGNAVYCVNGRNSGAIYLPADLSKVTSVICLEPGAGSTGINAYSTIVSDIKSGNGPDDVIIVFANNDSDSYSFSSALGSATGQNLTITNGGVATFSNGGRAGMIALGNAVNDYPNISFRGVNIDSYLTNYNQDVAKNTPQLSDSITAITEGNVPIINIIPYVSGAWNPQDRVTEATLLANSGFNSLMLRSDVTTHRGILEEAIAEGLVDLLSGGQLDTEVYSDLLSYNQETGSWENADWSVVNDGTVSSSYNYVYNSMNGLLRNIATYEINSDTQTTGIVGSFYGANNYYCGITNGVLSSLGDEAVAVHSIAKAFYELDQQASQMAEASLNGSEGLDRGVFALNETLSKGIDSLLDYSSYNSITERFHQGKIGATSITDINNAMRSVVTTLTADSENASALKGYITNFTSSIGEGKMLSGDIWNSVLNNMETYGDLMGIRQEASDFLLDTMKIAMEMVREAITDGYSDINQNITGKYFAIDAESVDDTHLEELQITLSGIKRNIYELKQIVAKMKSEQRDVDDYGQDKDGNPIVIGSHKEPSDEDIAAKEQYLQENEDLYTELLKIKTRIDNYVEACNKAQELIDAAIIQINNTYSSAAQAIRDNKPFEANFVLDFSAMNIDADSYRTNFNSYYTALLNEEESKREQTANTQTGTPPGNQTANPPGSQTGNPPGSQTTPPSATKPPADTVVSTPPIPQNEQQTIKPDPPYEKIDDVIETTPAVEVVELSTTPSQKPISETILPTSTAIQDISLGENSKVDGVLGNEIISDNTLSNIEGFVVQPEIIEIEDNDLASPVLSNLEPISKKIASNAFDSMNNSVAASAAITSGVGLATGGAAFIANKMIKGENEEDYELDSESA